MGFEKFLDEKEEHLELPKKNYKDRVNKAVDNTFEKDSLNLLNIKKEKTSKKVPMSIYFEKQDLDLLKAIALEKNTTVNKILMNIIKEPLDVTRNNLPANFDIDKKSTEY